MWVWLTASPDLQYLQSRTQIKELCNPQETELFPFVYFDNDPIFKIPTQFRELQIHADLGGGLARHSRTGEK